MSDIYCFPHLLTFARRWAAGEAPPPQDAYSRTNARKIPDVMSLNPCRDAFLQRQGNANKRDAQNKNKKASLYCLPLVCNRTRHREPAKQDEARLGLSGPRPDTTATTSHASGGEEKRQAPSVSKNGL